MIARQLDPTPVYLLPARTQTALDAEALQRENPRTDGLKVVNLDGKVLAATDATLAEALKIPVPNCVGLDYTYAELNVDADDEPDFAYDQPMPALKYIACWPHELEPGDVLEARTHTVNGSQLRQYRITAIAPGEQRKLVLSIEWLHTGNSDTQTIPIDVQSKPQVVGGSKVDRVRKAWTLGNTTLVEDRDGKCSIWMGTWNWRGSKGK